MWNDAVGYETICWALILAVAPRFLDWLALPTRLRWLDDFACGTGFAYFSNSRALRP